jgi:hypothetical protein
MLWNGVVCLLPRIWERHSYYTPEGVLDYILIVANAVGPQQAYSQKAKGEVEQRQAKVDAYGGPAIFTREGLETL